MKKIILIVSLLVSSTYADISMAQIRDMVKKIHDKREGINLEILKETKEPFVRLDKESNITTFVIPTKKEDEKLSLYAILNNLAYINGKWRGIKESVSGYVIMYIGKKGVVLRNNDEIKKLFLFKKRKNFITIKEGE